jgi:hypothetical protein
VRRTVTEDKGYVPDYTFSWRDFKKRLGITERDHVRTVTVRGMTITVIMPRDTRKDERAEYEFSQQEFKDLLGITDPRSVSCVFASVWSNSVDLSMYGEQHIPYGHPATGKEPKRGN